MLQLRFCVGADMIFKFFRYLFDLLLRFRCVYSMNLPFSNSFHAFVFILLPFWLHVGFHFVQHSVMVSIISFKAQNHDIIFWGPESCQSPWRNQGGEGGT